MNENENEQSDRTWNFEILNYPDLTTAPAIAKDST